MKNESYIRFTLLLKKDVFKEGSIRHIYELIIQNMSTHVFIEQAFKQ